MEKCFEIDCVGVRLVKEKPLVSDREINDINDVNELVKKHITDFDREVFAIIGFNTRMKPVMFNICHIGALDRSIVHPREVFKPLILSNSSSFIAYHNHPAGSLEASSMDLLVTKTLKEAGDVVGIQLNDHIICTDNGIMSIMNKEY